MFNKSTGNINNIPSFTSDNVTITNATITNLITNTITGPDLVTSTSNILDNSIIRGDGSLKGIQQSGVLIDDSNNMTGINSLSTPSITTDTISSTNNVVISTTGELKLASTKADESIKFVGSSTNNGAQVVVANVANENEMLGFAWNRSNSRGSILAFTKNLGFNQLEIGSDVTGNILKGETIFTKPSNQFIFRANETGNSLYINGVQPASGNLTYSIPDVGANSDFIMTNGNQTLAGVKSFSSQINSPNIALSNTSNQLTLGTTNTVTVNATAPIASRVHTIPDVTNSNFIMSNSNQTITGDIQINGALNTNSSIILYNDGVNGYHSLLANVGVVNVSHTLPYDSGIIAHTSNIPSYSNGSITSPTIIDGTMINICALIAEKMYKIEVWAEIPVSTTLRLQILRTTDSVSIMNLDCVGIGSAKFYSDSTVINQLTSGDLIECNASRISGAGVSTIYAVKIYA